MTVSVNITGLEPIAEAIGSLAHAISGQRITASITDRTAGSRWAAQAESGNGAQQAPATPTVQPQAALAAPAAAAPVAPAAPVASVPPAAVQTSAAAYTLDDLARAAMALMDSGRQGDLLGLLAQFGVAALPALQPAQFGAFATALRGLGAQI